LHLVSELFSSWFFFKETGLITLAFWMCVLLSNHSGIEGLFSAGEKENIAS
jgi:hypothetical protein